MKNSETLDDELLEAVRVFHARHHYAPTRRELMTLTGRTSAAGVTASMERLREAGKLTWKDGSGRTIRAIDEELPANSGGKA